MVPRVDEAQVLTGAFCSSTIDRYSDRRRFWFGPVLQARLVNVSHALKRGPADQVLARYLGRLRNTLVVAEVAVTLILLIGAALLVRTFANLRGVGPGFDSQHVLTFQVALSGPQYDTTAKVTEFYRRALERFASVPGVEAAAVTSSLPLMGQFNFHMPSR